MQDQAEFVCPLCEGEQVEDMGSRPREKCAGCNAKARTRASFLALRSAGAFDSGTARILMLSPDRSLAKETRHKTSNLHVRAPDPDRLRFNFMEVTGFDLADPDRGERFDYVVHNHFLDATPVDFTDAITALDGLLAPGGWHLFTVPVKGSVLDEAEPGSGADQRVERFGKADRYRTFGTDDIVPMLRELWATDNVLFPLRRRYGRKDLHRHGLNPRHFERPHSNTVFGRRLAG